MEHIESMIKNIDRRLVCILAAFALIVPCALLYHRYSTKRQAEEYLLSQDYQDAALLFEKLGDKEMAEQAWQLLTELQYSEASAAMQVGEYERAKETFISLGGYKDSPALARSCDFLRSCELIKAGDYFEARDVLSGFPEDYPGLSEAMDEACAGIRQKGLELALQNNYAGAADIWRQLGDYADCEKLVFRAERMLTWLAGDERFTGPGEPCLSERHDNVYVDEHAYIVIPENIDEDCRFLLYFPGGIEQELNIDFLYYYLMNPAPDTIAVFLRNNGIKDMAAKNSQALEIMDKVAAECGVFLHDIVVVGSSMGAYSAAHCPRLSMAELAVSVDCVLALDSGGDWGHVQALREEECVQTAKTGTEFFLFESPFIGLNRPAIKMMVENDIPVTMVACYFDEHERMTYDAMGMGVLHWAVGDRTEPCELDIYSFNRLYA